MRTRRALGSPQPCGIGDTDTASGRPCTSTAGGGGGGSPSEPPLPLVNRRLLMVSYVKQHTQLVNKQQHPPKLRQDVRMTPWHKAKALKNSMGKHAALSKIARDVGNNKSMQVGNNKTSLPVSSSLLQQSLKCCYTIRHHILKLCFS